MPDFQTIQAFQRIQQRFVKNHALNDRVDTGTGNDRMNLTAVNKINFSGLGMEAVLIDLKLHRSLYNFDQLKMLMPMSADQNGTVPLDAHFERKTLSFKRLDFFVSRRNHR
ncbi:MAG: hypothetical protein K0Q59_4679 [Paenibacillus sp.]|nr:hypothetical protein [Paenibacillus sp.]